MFDAAPDAMVGVDGEGGIVFANAQAHALFGWEPAGLVGQPIEVLLPEGSRSRHQGHRRGYAAAPRRRPMGAGLDLRGRRRDGSTFPAEVTLGPLCGDDGGVLVVAAVRDVTERRQAHARLRTLLEGAPDAVVGLEGHGRVVLISAQAEARFATSRARAVGAPFSALLAGTLTVDGEDVELVPAEDRTSLEEAVDEVLAGRRDELTLRFRVARPEGGHAVLEAVGRALSDGSGGGLLLISRDISEHVDLELALRVARDEADVANQAKNRFLSRVSHELRTPLNAILGFGQLLEMQKLPPQDAESVRHVLSGGHHLLGLVNEVLDLALIESDELVSSTSAVALGPLVRELLETLAPLAREQRVALDDRSPERCDVWVDADRDRLHQVLLNLVANGLKYNQPGGCVSLRATASDGVVRIEVVDDGWGIADADQHRLFHPFDRLGAASTDVEGTGIGLALSQALVRAMGGRIGVDSVEGRGSTFWVELAEAGSGLGPDADGTPGPATILLVEDDPANVLLTQRILQRFTHVTVVAATTGAEGLAQARASTPDLVLLDLRLPDMTGEEILAELRRGDETRRVPAVVLSADADPDRLAALRSSGAYGSLTKPIDLPEFLRLVTEVLARRSG